MSISCKIFLGFSTFHWLCWMLFAFDNSTSRCVLTVKLFKPLDYAESDFVAVYHIVHLWWYNKSCLYQIKTSFAVPIIFSHRKMDGIHNQPKCILDIFLWQIGNHGTLTNFFFYQKCGTYYLMVSYSISTILCSL